MRFQVRITSGATSKMLGNTRVWVCKQLSALKKRGLIAYRHGQLVILDEAGLRQLAPPA